MHNKINISSVGDISFGCGFKSEHTNPGEWISESVKEALSADITIGNLECVIRKSSEHTPIEDELSLSEDAEPCLEALKAAGFNILTLANNHVMDYYGKVGLKGMIEQLEGYGFKHCGAGMTLSAANAPCVIEIRGKRVAVLSRLHPPSFVDASRLLATTERPGVAALDTEEVCENAQYCKEALGCDFVILHVHWGLQELSRPHPAVHDLACKLVSGAVDLILGNHAHVIQGIHQYNGKTILFGQGNFYFQPFFWRNKLHYGPECLRNRKSYIARFEMEESNVDLKLVKTVQTAGNVVEAEGRLSEDEFKYLCKIGQRKPLAFHLRWRLLEYKKLFSNFSKIGLFGVFLKVFKHPRKLGRILLRVLSKPTHR
jgi:poly-gamma-glutamate capsule biosynthesis protein CapA/YwtB (metallophosphatase superfamily)